MTIRCEICKEDAAWAADDGRKVVPLCSSCAEAYEMGQNDPGTDVVHMDLVIGRVRDLAYDMGVKLTEDQAEYIVSKTWRYADPEDAIIKIANDQIWEYADRARDLAMDR